MQLCEQIYDKILDDFGLTIDDISTDLSNSLHELACDIEEDCNGMINDAKIEFQELLQEERGKK